MSLLTPASPIAAVTHDEREHLRGLWWLFLVLGLVSIFVGFLAIGATWVATLASLIVFGVLLLVAGVTEVIHAVMVHNLKGFALHLLAANLYLFVGLFMLELLREDPFQAAKDVTLVLLAAFLVGGVLRILFSIIVQFAGWPWVALNGAVNLLLAFIILSEWPESALWAIGLLVGIDLIFHGWSWVIMALTVRLYSAAVAH
jgi:uncharacterized membrane protein HdeD (DUF308 family)